MNYKYKPQGSEKITDLNEKARRIAELSGIKSITEKKQSTPTLSTTGRYSNILHEIEAPNGKQYAIVQENKYIYIKENVNDVYEYIGGVRNIKEHSYKNYASAMRHLNLMVQQINESMGLGGMDILSGKKKTLN